MCWKVNNVDKIIREGVQQLFPNYKVVESLTKNAVGTITDKNGIQHQVKAWTKEEYAINRNTYELVQAAVQVGMAIFVITVVAAAIFATFVPAVKTAFLLVNAFSFTVSIGLLIHQAHSNDKFFIQKFLALQTLWNQAMKKENPLEESKTKMVDQAINTLFSELCAPSIAPTQTSDHRTYLTQALNVEPEFAALCIAKIHFGYDRNDSDLNNLADKIHRSQGRKMGD